MKRILGLGLGTNSIGWSLINSDFLKKEGNIDGIGVRIIPMGQDTLGKFDAGISISQTAERTKYRGVRRLYQRDNLRRDRLHRALHILGFLPKHYTNDIDFVKHFGQFKSGTETKLPYRKDKEGKHHFIFQESFQEMVDEFKAHGQDIKIPYDWTIYYLRKKALFYKIKKEELAWLILNFNQKRGYYQLRGEEEETDKGKIEEFYALRVVNVVKTEDKNVRSNWYNVVLENGWIYRRQSKEPLFDWKEKIKEFIVTTTLDDNGSVKQDKEGHVKRSFRSVDSEKDWIAIKKKTENDIAASGKTVGHYIHEALLKNPTQKIRGKLVKTIERKKYRDELHSILKKQMSFHPELQDAMLYKACVEELYPRNEAHQKSIANRNFDYLFLDDIIFYQRPLKCKKSNISDCPYEYRVFKRKNGENVKKPLKSIPKSNPLFQEFRLWQFLDNLKIYKLDGKGNTDVTAQFFKSDKDWVSLFDFLNDKRAIDEKAFLKQFKLTQKTHRWNYVSDKKYPCNDTRGQIKARLMKVGGVDVDAILSAEFIRALWHIIYSVTDKLEFEKALETFANKYYLNTESFVEHFKKFPPFVSSYGAYSEKAIKKLLPLIRMGKHWNESAIDIKVKNRIDSIRERLAVIDFRLDKLDSIEDDDIPKQLLKSFAKTEERRHSGLNTYQACYVVYERHSEVGDIKLWKQPRDITEYLQDFKQHSLRNPIVEQVVLETLRIVRDIWKYYGTYKEVNGEKVYDSLFDEIHVELGREMKNDQKTRKRISESVTERENTNERIRALLEEIKNDTETKADVRPYSPSHQEILKLYEDGVYDNPNADYKVVPQDEVEKIRKNNAPTKSELIRYKLWLQQGYISPYTGNLISLTKLFTTEYQIEHIIPQSRYFDNSLSNKVICESTVNEEKDNETAYAFFKKRGGEIIDLGQGKSVKLFSLEDYENHCKVYFKKNKSKLTKLLSEVIPEGFINRQLNDSLYINKLVKELLSNIVREEGEQEATSKHLVPVNGIITSKLKKDWGLYDKWNEVIAPRFIRLNELTKSNDFGYWEKDINAFKIQVPEELTKNFSNKRIDHRHHALDALVIACTTKDHTNYITSLNTERKNHSLVSKLREVEKKQIKDKKNGGYKTVTVARAYIKPWADFTIEAKESLEKIVVSFKQNLRVINKTNNKTQQWVKKDGKLKKEIVRQTKGQNWAIRKSLHKETVSGKVIIKREKGFVSINSAIDNWEFIINIEIKNKIMLKVTSFESDLKKVKKYFKENPIEQNGKTLSKISILENVEATATRTALTEKFTRKQLESITDSGIQKILNNHLNNYIDKNGKERFDLAFNSVGLDEMNKSIQKLNRGKPHQPIRKVRIYEVGNKFSIGENGVKSTKYVEAAKGTNLFYNIYQNINSKKRIFDVVPLNEVIAHQKWRATLDKNDRNTTSLTPIKNPLGTILFYLNPNDLVFMPTKGEVLNSNLVDFSNLNTEQVNRLFVVNDFSTTCYFTPNNHAKAICPKEVDMSYNEKKKQTTGSYDDKTASFEGEQIKSKCWKLKCDLLGNLEIISK